MGKIQVIKSLIIPKFLYRLINTTDSETIVKEINKLMFNFIWNGHDKIKRLAIINDIDKVKRRRNLIIVGKIQVIKSLIITN